MHLLTVFWRPNPIWGTDFLFYAPRSYSVFFALAAVPLFIQGFRRKLCAIVCRLTVGIWNENGHVWFARAAILILALAAFVAMPSARRFLGDGYILLE